MLDALCSHSSPLRLSDISARKSGNVISSSLACSSNMTYLIWVFSFVCWRCLFIHKQKFNQNLNWAQFSCPMGCPDRQPLSRPHHHLDWRSAPLTKWTRGVSSPFYFDWWWWWWWFTSICCLLLPDFSDINCPNWKSLCARICSDLFIKTYLSLSSC